MATEAGINEPYKAAQKLLLDVQNSVASLSEAYSDFEETTNVNAIFLGQLASDLQTLNRASQDLEKLVALQPPAKRDLWKHKVRQLADETRALRRSLDTFIARRPAASEESPGLRQRGGDGSVVAALYSEREAISASRRMADELEEVGVGIVGSLQAQNNSLRSAQLGAAINHQEALLDALGGRPCFFLDCPGDLGWQLTPQDKLYQMATSIGLARSIIKAVERRQRGDQLLMLAGMLFVLALLFYFWWF